MGSYRSKLNAVGISEDSLFVDAGGAYLLGTSSDLSFRYVGRWQSEYETASP